MQIGGTIKYHGHFRRLIEMLALTQKPHSEREKLFLEVQIEMLRERLDLQKIQTTAQEREVLLEIGLPLGERVKNLIRVVQYETYLDWQNNRIHRKYARTGIKRDASRIILQIARQTGWGYSKIAGELRKLRLKTSKSTVKNILKQNNIPIAQKRKTNEWLDCLKRHFQTLWACDFFTQEITGPLGKSIHYILFFINMKTRKVYIAGSTEHPTQTWVYNQVKDIFSELAKDKKGKTILIRDRDAKYPKRLDRYLRQCGVSVKVLPPRSPNLNAHAESFVARMRGECLNYFTAFSEAHLRYLITEFVKYYNTVRPHSGLGYRCIDYAPGKKSGELKYQEILGGLIKHYYWG